MMTMKNPIRPGSRPGQALAFVAVALVVLLAVSGLVIDLGRAFTAHGEAQRAADSGALAGASAFLDHDAAVAEGPARERAVEFARRNAIRNAAIDSAEVSVQVIVDSAKVRVAVRRTGIPTWFARLFGVDVMAISADAAAMADATGSAKCVKPFTIPDAWSDADDDLNGNGIWDDDEVWEYGDDAGDRYRRYETGEASETGYASPFRNGRLDAGGYAYDNDYGRRVVLKRTDPNSTSTSGFFQPWVMPGSDPGAADYRENIANCNAMVIDLGQEYEIDTKTGDMVGPTQQGMQDLIDLDPDAYWDDASRSVKGSSQANWMDSPRIVIVPLYHPAEIDKPGKTSITFNNFGLFFIEEQATRHDPITGRFLYFTTGVGGNAPLDGSLVKVIRLVE